jgi:UDP-glucose 4-epimerase
MKILISGGLGYLGGRVAEHLRVSAPGAGICLTTRDEKKELPAWSRNFSVVRLDVRDPVSIAACLDVNKPDVIIQLAALNDIQCAKDPDAALEVNTRGTYRLLEGARAAGVGRFIYFSTIHVYGPVLSGTLTEDSPTAPVHPYAITHRAAEDMVNYFRHYHGMRTLVFRMSNGYGYPMNKEVDTWALVFNDLCRQLMTTGRIVLRSSGKQRRDFIPLSDAAEAVRHFLFSAPDDSWNRLYHLGAGRSISILEAAREIELVYRAKYGREPGALTAAADKPGAPAAAVDYRVERIAAAGFVPKGDMSAEIEKTLEICGQFLKK